MLFKPVLNQRKHKMNKKLFTVSVSFDYVVAADDIHAAYDVAYENATSAFGETPRTCIMFDVVPGTNATGWDGDCIPYGGDGNTRTKDYT